MFKSSKWKKEKMKAVFRMQFQVTQVPQLKAKKLMISLVPADGGKPTVRLGKSPIVEGTCSWEDPIYETVKLVRDPKTATIKQNIYYFVVASGSSKSSFLGEVGLNFADLVEATETLVVSLPLMPLETGTILHVAVQNMQGAQETRCTPEDSEISRTGSLDLSFETEQGSGRCGDGLFTSTDGEELNETSRHSKQNSVSQDPQPKNSLANQFTVKNTTNSHLHQRSSTDCSLGSDLDGSVNDTIYKPDEHLSSQETSSNSFESMKHKIMMLERQSELSEIELQTLRKQIVKETKRAQEQSRQIVNLKDERHVLKTKCEKLKLRCTDKVDADNTDDKSSTTLLEEIKHKLLNEKNLNSKLMLKLQKTEDSNSELILTVRDLNKMLDQKDKDIFHLSEKVRSNKDLLEASHLKSQNEDRKVKIADLSQATRQTIEKLQNEIEVYKGDNEELKAKIDQLESHCQELEKENDEINHNLEQCELQNEKAQTQLSESVVTVKHFKLQVERLEEELKRQTSLYSKSLDTINELETHVLTMEKELEKQAHEFEEHLEEVTQAKVKQEQRAIKAEEALRRARWSNAKAAQKLQEELKRLSDEMTLKIDEKEKLANDSVMEANVLREENKILEGLLQKSEELKSTKDHYEREVLELKASSMETERLNQAGSGYCKEMKHRGGVRCYAEQMVKLNAEKELERELTSVRREAEMFLEELIPLRTVVDQKKKIEDTLQSEVEKLHLQIDEMRCSTDQLKSENENLMKLVLKLQENESPGEETPDSIVDGGRKCKGENIHLQKSAFTEEGRFMQNGSRKIANITSGEFDLGRVTETIDGHTQKIQDPEELPSEVALLKERNKHMERELKEMEERYSEISLKFAEVEGERQQLVMALRNLKNGKR